MQATNSAVANRTINSDSRTIGLVEVWAQSSTQQQVKCLEALPVAPVLELEGWLLRKTLRSQPSQLTKELVDNSGVARLKVVPIAGHLSNGETITKEARLEQVLRVLSGTQAPQAGL